jgi:predicted flap endonuclease-1-like 5' DNA nuclease
MNLQQILSNLFSFGNSYEAIVFSVILVLTLLFGMLFNYLLFSGPAFKKRRKEISDLKSEIETAQAKIKLSEEKYSVQVSKTKRLEEDATKVQVTIDDLNQKNNTYKNESAQLQFEKETLQRRAENAEKEINELKNLYKISQDENLENEERLSKLIKEKNETLSKFEELKNVLEEIDRERHDNNENVDENTLKNAELKAGSERLAQEKELLNAEINRLNVEVHDKEKKVLETLKELSVVKQALIEQELKNEKNQQNPNLENAEQALNESEPNVDQVHQDELIIPMDREEDVVVEVEEMEELPMIAKDEAELINEESSAAAETEDNAIDSNQQEKMLKDVLELIGQSNAEQPDNLKLINEIDTDLELKLLGFGIETFEQISKLSEETLNQKLCKLLNIKDKTIDRNQWAAQARQLLIKQKISNLTKDINLNKLFKK